MKCISVSLCLFQTFTGPFVYCLLPVFSSSTIQSVLASIGYLLHTDSEYRLSEDANPDRAMLVGFELLLATVQCRHFLELLDKDQLGPQEWLEVLQRRMEPSKQEEPTEKKTTVVQKEEEKKKEKADGAEMAPYFDTRKPQAKPRRCHLISMDHSIMEMQMNYPDLAFRELQTKRPTSPGPPSLSSTDEEQELRELAERMGQLHVQETKVENKSGEESTIKERRKKERKVSTEGEAEEQNLRRPVMETGPALSCAASRCTRSSQYDPTVMKEPKPVCHPPPQTNGGGSAVQPEGEDSERAEKGRAEEEQLAQSFVIVERHKK
ncbi:hypothetical protein GBF38_001908 [Nibea albiflora]|uniref:Uncharacterized protein n=1 Tax=Nibea albiflora TaxID=240163 RepID=A0ACB7EDG2_NIBAL|nr:hypothetical protein GBF38_001908 [Nibea albiflora]